MHEQEIKEFGDTCEIFRPLWPVVRVLLWLALLMIVMKWVMP